MTHKHNGGPAFPSVNHPDIPVNNGMSAQHTPGPWRTGPSPTADCRIYADSSDANHAIAKTYGPDLNGIGVCDLTGPRNRADAKLIAAAPEMLDMMYLALQFIEESMLCPDARTLSIDDAMAQIQAVIAKARGRQ